MAFPSPSLSPPALSNWQFQFNGFTFGAGTAAGELTVNGLGDLAIVNSNDPQRSRDYGEMIGLDLYGGRDITIDFFAKSDGVSLQDTLSQLATATVCQLDTEEPMWFQIPNYPLLCSMVRPRKRATPWDANYAAANVAYPVAQFHSTDPRVYGIGQQATVGLNPPTAGMTFPARFPLTFGTSSPNGLVVANSGNTEMRPILVLTGPVTNPSIANATISTTPTLVFSNPNQTTFTVLSGDQMVIDLDFHSVLYYSGGISAGNPASRTSWLVPGSVWWDILPGNNIIQFHSADSGTVAGTCTVQWASAYQL